MGSQRFGHKLDDWWTIPRKSFDLPSKSNAGFASIASLAVNSIDLLRGDSTNLEFKPYKHVRHPIKNRYPNHKLCPDATT
jgi:hypothetical protein